MTEMNANGTISLRRGGGGFASSVPKIARVLSNPFSPHDRV